MNRKMIPWALVLLALGAGAGWWVSRWSASPTSPAAPAERRVLYWYDPMVPGQRFDKPGKSPFMDMQLQPRYADEPEPGGPALQLDARTVQALGLRTVPVQRREVAAAVEVPGTLQLNERDVSLVQARSGGFVEKVHAHAPGEVIAAGAPLADLLLPDWLAAQREFLAVRALGDVALTDAARQRLPLLGMPAALIAEVERSGQVQARHTVVAPRTGLLAELMVRQGMTVSAGMSLARINGLDPLWFEVAVPELQAGAIALGQETELRLAAYGAEVFKARVSAVLPEASRETRTLRLRLELPNPGLRLKAGLSGQARLQGTPRTALLLPSEAVVRSGRRAIVYAVDAPGRFHPVEVQLGAELGDELVITGGLEAGQSVVASATFLIDSEASLRGVLPVPAASEPAPVAQAVSHSALGRIEDLGAGELMLSHEAIPALRWPAMTMGFKLAEPRLAAGLTRGQTVRFSFVQRGDEPVITAIQPVAPAAAASRTGGRP